MNTLYGLFAGKCDPIAIFQNRNRWQCHHNQWSWPPGPRSCQAWLRSPSQEMNVLPCRDWGTWWYYGEQSWTLGLWSVWMNVLPCQDWGTWWCHHDQCSWTPDRWGDGCHTLSELKYMVMTWSMELNIWLRSDRWGDKCLTLSGLRKVMMSWHDQWSWTLGLRSVWMNVLPCWGWGTW